MSKLTRFGATGSLCTLDEGSSNDTLCGLDVFLEGDNEDMIPPRGAGIAGGSPNVAECVELMGVGRLIGSGTGG